MSYYLHERTYTFEYNLTLKQNETSLNNRIITPPRVK